MDIMPMEVRASTPRRMFMMGALGALALIFLALALSAAPQAMGWRIAFLACGALVLGFLPFAWRATGIGLVLDRRGLSDTEGRLICALDDIARVERGAFAFKPSNGFLIHTRSKAPRGWAPGIWWRMGRQVGVGGVLPASHAKNMAEAISFWLAARDIPENE